MREMEAPQRLAILKQIDLFQSLSPEELQRFSEAVIPIHLEAETILFQEGDAGRSMYILAAGSVQIFKKNRCLTTILPPDYIGEMSMIEDKPRSATVIAAAGSKLLEINSRQFETFASQPKTLVAIIKTLSRRIRQDNELISAEFNKANILIHDMRNTMSSFIMLDQLAKTCEDKKQLKYLELMQKGRRYLAEMLEEALANAKRLHFNKTAKDDSLTALIAEMAAGEFTVHPDVSDKKIILDLADQVPLFTFCNADIRRLLANLVINAAQASKPAAEIHISLTCDQHQVAVSVTDHGCGIKDDIKNKIFLPNFSNKDKGNGFGLASCKQIVEEHHGKLSFTSKAGEGSTFTFSLPTQANDKSKITIQTP